jgi:hypothetical protein
MDKKYKYTCRKGPIILRAICKVFGGHDGPIIESGQSDKICMNCGSIYKGKV